MKKILIILLGVTLVLPLFAAWDEDEEEEGFDPTRRSFEIGFDAGAGLANGIASASDIFKKNIELDLGKIAKGIPDEGSGLNFGLSAGFFVDIKDITIGEGVWNFGFIIGVDGGVNMNISKSLFTLINEGNIDKHDSKGEIGASGGIFTEIGLRSSAKYEVADRILHVGVKPAVFTPAIYIPSNSKITYSISSKNDKGEEGIFVTTAGGLEIYSATSLESLDDEKSGAGKNPAPLEPGRFLLGPSGFDLSLEGEYYDVIPFLDVGVSLANIPFAPATLENLMKMSMRKINIGLTGSELISGEAPDVPEIDFEKTYSNSVKKEVYRPLRLDIFARYRPLQSDWLIIKPNLGLSVNINKGDEKTYFNGGLELRTNLIKVFTIYVSSSYREELWRQKAGLGINVRAFELDLEAAFMDQTFMGCFEGRGIDFNLGLRFGW